MHIRSILLGLTALSAVQPALAVVDNSVSVYNDYRLIADNGQIFKNSGFREVDDRPHSDPVALTLTSPATSRDFWNADLASHAAAEAGHVTAAASVNWGSPADSTLKPLGSGSRAESWTGDSSGIAHRGRIQFTVDYQLAAVGEGARAQVDFHAVTFFVDRSSGYSVIEPFIDSDANPVFSKTLDGTAEAAYLNDSWTSDWYYFDSQTDLDSVNGTRFIESASGNLKAAAYFYGYEDGQVVMPASGTWLSYADARLSYRVERWDQGIPDPIRLPTTPVPEPETYALFGAGLAALGLARRFRRV